MATRSADPMKGLLVVVLALTVGDGWRSISVPREATPERVMACILTMRELNARLDKVRAQAGHDNRKLLLSLHPRLSVLEPGDADAAKFECRIPMLVDDAY